MITLTHKNLMKHKCLQWMYNQNKQFKIKKGSSFRQSLMNKTSWVRISVIVEVLFDYYNISF